MCGLALLSRFCWGGGWSGRVADTSRSGDDWVQFDIPTDVQRLRTSERGVRYIPELLFVESHMGQTACEFLQIDGHLESSKVVPQAHVGTRPERDVWIGLAVDIESLGIIEHRRVAVRRCDHHEDLAARGNRDVADLHVLLGDSSPRRDRRTHS